MSIRIKRNKKMVPNIFNKFYIKVKMQINNTVLYHLGFTNTIIRIVEMKKIQKTEFIKIERTITKGSYGLEWRDRLIQLSSNGGYDLSPEFKNQLWEDMSIDVDELGGEFIKKML